MSFTEKGCHHKEFNVDRLVGLMINLLHFRLAGGAGMTSEVSIGKSQAVGPLL